MTPITFIHETAIIEEGATVGSGTRIWAFAHVLSGAVIGAECNICDHTFVEGNVSIGDRVTLKNGVYLWEGVAIGDDVFIGPNATFTNDRFPRSRRRPERLLETAVRNGASIGANATIIGGLVIGKGAMVGAGSVVTADVEPYTVVAGSPARLLRRLDGSLSSADGCQEG